MSDVFNPEKLAAALPPALSSPKAASIPAASTMPATTTTAAATDDPTAATDPAARSFLGSSAEGAAVSLAQGKNYGSTWVKKTDYNYKAYTATPEQIQALEAAGEVETWASKAKKYEWEEEYGDVGPAVPELEKELFGDENIVRTGVDFAKVKEVDVVQEGVAQINPVRQFEDAGLHPIMLRNVQLCGYEACTPIQAYCIPAILQGVDVYASAHTGSGKTAAYLIPILSKLMGKAKTLAAPRPNPATFNPATDSVRAEPLVVVIAPTRELATQIFDEARRFCYRSMLRPCVVYGGVPPTEQRKDLQRGCDILIGTPGRICDFMDRTHVLSLRRVRYTVVDEADEILQSDWEDELKKIMHGGDNNPDDDHVYLMFSATFPKEARNIAKTFLSRDHIRIAVGRPGSTHTQISQRIVSVARHLKNRALYELLLSLPAARTIIFVNRKQTADAVDDYLFNADFPSTSIHSDRTQREREDSLRAFRRGKAPLLVATGVSARGLDIRDVMHVINYDLPSMAHGGIQEYIHRIGRTARIGNPGIATSFFTEDDEEIAELLVKTMLETGQEIPDFLQKYAPEGTEKLVFEDDSEDEHADFGAAAAPDAATTVPGAGLSDLDWGIKTDDAPVSDEKKASDGGHDDKAGVKAATATPESATEKTQPQVSSAIGFVKSAAAGIWDQFKSAEPNEDTSAAKTTSKASTPGRLGDPTAAAKPTERKTSVGDNDSWDFSVPGVAADEGGRGPSPWEVPAAAEEASPSKASGRSREIIW